MRPSRFPLLTAAAVLTAVLTAPPVLAGAGHSHGQDDQIADGEKQPSIAATKLNDTLTLLSGVDGFTGGNVVVSNGPDGVLIIDDKVPDMTDTLVAALNDIGGVDRLKYVLNTHWHFDHTGGNATLGKVATIIAHTNVRKRLSTAQAIDLFEMKMDPAPESAWPQITYDDGLSIHFNGEEIRLLHMPSSHTDTDTVVYFAGSNVLHTGDLFFNGIFPFVDIQNGGNVTGMANSVERLMTMFPADATIVPGHGPLATMADLKTFYTMLTETTANVQAMINAGNTLDQIKAAGVPAAWDGWAWRLDGPTWNAIIHSSLTQ